MEEIEITSWNTLEAIENAAAIVDTVGDLQSGHMKSVFCVIEDDYLELGYLDAASNYLRRYENREEFDLALSKLKEEEGESPTMMTTTMMKTSGTTRMWMTLAVTKSQKAFEVKA